MTTASPWSFHLQSDVSGCFLLVHRWFISDFAMKSSEDNLVAARAALSQPMTFDAFLAKLPNKDRVAAEKRVAVLEADQPDGGRGRLWRRLACSLMTLAPHAAKLVGRQTVQFYVADGKYRKQVFALEDLQDGNMTIYCPDALTAAVEAGLLSPPPHPDGGEVQLYLIRRTGDPLRVEALHGSSLNPGAHFKDLTGWNRKALRITLPPSPSAAQVEAAELLCAIAAGQFVPNPPPAA
jgi:hypothetical protein